MFCVLDELHLNELYEQWFLNLINKNLSVNIYRIIPNNIC